MPIFKQRPPQIEARQFETNTDADRKHIKSLVDWIKANGGRASHDLSSVQIDNRFAADNVAAGVGDWIVRGEGGVFAVLTDTKFKELYELA